MKKILFGLSAFTMLFATSCQNDLDFDTTVEKTSTVSFSVGTPEIATRAYSDGTTATHLQYAVYDAAGNQLTDLTVTKGEIHGSTTVKLQLTTGNTYSVIFWAAAPDAPYTVDFDTKTMTVAYDGAVCNAENRDAFYKYHTFTVKGAQTETIELKRPFAQLNIGTADYAASERAGYIPTQSAVVVKNVYSTLNLATGVVSGEVEANFALADIKKDETFPVDGNEYLAMNYLLVGADKETVDIKFTYTDGSNAKTRTVGSVPVQRNYRTNIYGNLLTSEVDVNVEIKPEYDGTHELDALHKAALNGGVVTLTEDVTLTAPLEVVADMVLDLNGHIITGAYSKSEGAIIKNNGSLKLVGGTISSTGANGGSAIANYGELVVEDTEIIGASIRENDGWPAYPINNYGDMTLKNATITGYQGAVACGEAGTTILENCTINKEYLNTSSHVFYIYHKDAHVIVNGGTYTHNGMDGSLAYVISGSITVNDGTFSTTGGGYGMAPLTNGKVVINGGSFAAMPINWGGSIILNGGTFNKKPTAAWIAEGYKAVEKNGKFFVVANDVTVATTQEELAAALAAGGKIFLVSDVDLAKIDLTTQTQDVVIDGNGNTIKTSDCYGVEATAGKNITLKNAKIGITAKGDYITYAAGFKIANGDYQNKTIKLENCEIIMANTDWAYAINMPAGVQNLNLVIDNCTLEGAIALQCWGDNNTITVTNSNLICNYTTSALYTSYCVALQGDNYNKAENNTLNISGCSFLYSGIDNFNSEIRSVDDVSNANTISVSDCTYGEKVAAYNE